MPSESEVVSDLIDLKNTSLSFNVRLKYQIEKDMIWSWKTYDSETIVAGSLHDAASFAAAKLIGMNMRNTGVPIRQIRLESATCAVIPSEA